ncbi:hypothetical protein, partial [Salmonella sp. 6309]|uniref:hypothetical protein n=1 Tax=Salmonella sp. 6309 TaxID=3159579 RepID=UPI003979B5B8
SEQQRFEFINLFPKDMIRKLYHGQKMTFITYPFSPEHQKWLDDYLASDPSESLKPAENQTPANTTSVNLTSTEQVA